MFWGSSLGFAAGSLGAGVVASAGYGWLFLADAVTCAAFAAVVWRYVPGLPGRPPSAHHGWSGVLADRVSLGFLALQLVAGVAMFQLYSVGGLTLHGAGVTTALFGVLLAASAALAAAGQPLVGPWLLARDPSAALAGAAGLTAVGCVLAAVAATPLAVAPAVAALAAGQVVTYAVAPGVVASLGAGLQGHYQGLAGASYSLAFLLAPLFGAGVLAAASAEAAWLCSAALCLVVVAGHLTLAPALRARLR
jgi:hypothetical protein